MDIINTTRPVTFGAALNTVFANVFGSLTNKIIAEFKANRTRKALSALSARQLEDIGLTYGDIDAVSRATILR